MLLEDCLTKILKTAKGTLSDLLPMDVLDSIHNWIINLEYHDKHRTIISQIKIQGSPVLHTLLFEYWTSYHNFGPLNFYSSTRYEWAHRLSKKYPCGLRTKTTLDQK